MYTGKLKVTCQELNDVYRSARKLGMKGALEKCIELLRVTSDNFQNMVHLYVTARKLDLLDASVRAFKLMQQHFERLVTTEEFLDLELDQVLELLSSEEIGARSEIIVFLAALKWINHRYIDREEHIVTVLRCVRFPLMSLEEILACYHPPVMPGIVNIPAIRAALLNATCYIAAKSINQEHLFLYLAAKPRTFLYAGEPMILWDLSIFDRDKFNEIKREAAATKIQAAVRGYLSRKHMKEDYYIANCAATVIQSVFRGYYVRKALQLRKDIMEGEGLMPESSEKKSYKSLMSPFSSKILEGVIDPQEMPYPPSVLYVMGAFNSQKGSEGQNVIFKFNAKEVNWEFVTKCPVPLHDVRMLSTHEALYIIGGYNPLDRNTTGAMYTLKDCYQYQFKEGKWTHLPSMNHGRSLHGAAAFDGKILAIGGRDEDNRILSSIEQYSAFTNNWEEFVQPLPEPRMGMGVASDGSNSLWIAGGMSSDGENVNLLDSVWCFSKEAERWIKTVILPDPIAFPVLLYDKNQLFLIGGAIRTNREDKSQLKSVETVLCLEGETWIEKAEMPVQCHSAIATKYGKNIYVFGGFRTQTMSQLTDAILFDGNIQEWHRLCDLPEEAAGFMVALSKHQS